MMRRLATLSLLFILAAGCRSATLPSWQFGSGTEALLAAQSRLHSAIASRKQSELDRLLAPEYTFHYIDHEVRGTMQAMPTAPRGKWVLKMLEETGAMPLQSSIVDARVHGETGIVVSHYRWGGGRGNHSFSYEGYLTDIWVRRDGKWRLLASHAQLLPPWQ